MVINGLCNYYVTPVDMRLLAYENEFATLDCKL